MPAKKLVRALLGGETLKVVLTPDPVIPHNQPEIQESFELPHIVIDRENFWGKTTNVISLDFHVGIPEKYDLRLPGAYAYSNYADLVINSSFLSGLTRCYDARSYSQMDFLTFPDHALVWEHGKSRDMRRLRKAIAQGKNLKVALKDGENYWNIHPVNMPSIRANEDWFQLFTEKDAYPLLLRLTQSVMGLSDSIGARLDAASNGDRAKLGDRRTVVLPDQEFFSCFYRVFSNGKYARGLEKGTVAVGDDGKAEVPVSLYQELRVFAEK